MTVGFGAWFVSYLRNEASAIRDTLCKRAESFGYVPMKYSLCNLCVLCVSVVNRNS